MIECGGCLKPIVKRTSRHRFCSTRCKQAFARAWLQAEAYFNRPRCIVCSGPMKYGQPCIKLSSRTCSTVCSKKFWHWRRDVVRRPERAA